MPSAVAGGRLSVPHYCSNTSVPHLARLLMGVVLTQSVPQKHCYTAELVGGGWGPEKPLDKRVCVRDGKKERTILDGGIVA